MTHPFVKMNPATKEFEESAVYNQKTGEKILCWPVDAREIVAQSQAAGDGLFAATPPDAAFVAPEPKAAKEVQVADAVPEVIVHSHADEVVATPASAPAAPPPRRGRPPSK